MKKLSTILLSIAALSLISVCTGCSNAFESISETSSIKINTRELLAGVSANRSVYARQVGEEIIAELSITVSGSGIKTQTKNIGFTGRTMEEYLNGDKSIVFTGIPEGKEITISGKYKRLPTETYPERWTGTVKYITGSKEPVILELTSDIPFTGTTFQIVNTAAAEDFTQYLENGGNTFTFAQIFENESTLGCVKGSTIELNVTENITLDSPLILASTGVYYHINLNGHKLILNYNQENYENSKAGFSIKLNDSAEEVNVPESNLYFYNGTITSTEDDDSTITLFYLNGCDKGGIISFKNCTFTNLKHQIIECNGEGTVIFNSCTIKDCTLTSEESSFIQTSVWTDGAVNNPTYGYSTLKMRNTTIKNCKTYTKNIEIAAVNPLITAKGTAIITDCNFETDYSSLQEAAGKATVLLVKDWSTAAITGTKIVSKGSLYAVKTEAKANLLFNFKATYSDDGYSYYTEDKSSVIAADNAINLCTEAQGNTGAPYYETAYLAAAYDTKITGKIQVGKTVSDTVQDGYSLIGTYKLKNILNVEIFTEETPAPSNDFPIVFGSDYTEVFPGLCIDPANLDKIKDTVSRINLLNEDYMLNSEGKPVSTQP